MTCPDYEQLLVALDEPSRAPEVASHLAGGCPHCARRRRLVREMFRALAAGALPTPEEGWQRAAEGVPAAPHRDLPSRWSGAEVDDPTPALALRGASLCQRHMSYSAGPFEVDLALLDRATLVGTVTRRIEDAAIPDAVGLDRYALDDAVCVLSGAGGPRQVALEPNGDFRFEGVDPGHYLLLVETPGGNLVLDDVDLTTEDDHR